MAKLYFKFGAMGCSKTAQALITKFNYEERGMKVLLVKPAIDNRDGATIVRSRIGLNAEAITVGEDNIYRLQLTITVQNKKPPLLTKRKVAFESFYPVFLHF